jgi:hypothetical protein
MRAFISYATEQRDIAERLAIGLRGLGAHVFFDRDTIVPGDSFDERIRVAIRRSQLFIFLISPESVRKGAYTMTELHLAEEHWPLPSGKILPVVIGPVRIETAKEYRLGDLRSVVARSCAETNGCHVPGCNQWFLFGRIHGVVR